LGSTTKRKNEELPIIQQTYDLIKWYVPLINKLPRDHKYLLGDRLIRALYDTLEDLLKARYSTHKLPLLEAINLRLDIIRYQTRLLRDFEQMDLRRYAYALKLINDIGRALGGWIGPQWNLV
jgi:uncharacterized membrane protein YheB (UPF0754 family)